MQPFAFPGPAADPHSVRLRPPRYRVSRKAIPYWTVRALLGWVVLGVVEGLWLAGGTASGWQVAAVAATGVAAVVHLVVMPQWRFRVHLWETTSEAVYAQSGWFNQERRIAPVSRIQTVDSERGPLEQIFGLANVTVTTASAAGPIKIHGLDRETAQRLVDELTANTQAMQGDAT